MELGEPVNVAIPGPDDEGKCPFAHKKPESTLKNELGGIGSTLGDNMGKGKGVHTAKPPDGGNFTKGVELGDPRDRGAKGFHSVYVTVSGKTVTLEGASLPYPLTCAAHHLIPAQEALKDHDILKFMCEKDDPQDFRNGAAADTRPADDSLVWGNVAYNVNGCHNGTWLPGNYAVGAGVGGVGIWRSRASGGISTEGAQNWQDRLDLSGDEWAPLSVDPIENEGPQPKHLSDAVFTATAQEYMLAGTNYNIDEGNPKWAYVKAAMDRAGSQFHDRHADYSKEVQKYLGKIADMYQRMYDKSKKKEKPCKECEESSRPAKPAGKELIGPPYGIVSRLVTASNFFNGYVGVPTAVAYNIYTSKWVRAWMDTRASAKVKAGG